jgi:hypothetical protein
MEFGRRETTEQTEITEQTEKKKNKVWASLKSNPTAFRSFPFVPLFPFVP